MEYLEINGTVKVNPNYPCAIQSLASELSALAFVDDEGYMLVTMTEGELGIEGEGRVSSFFHIDSILKRLTAYLLPQSTIDVFRDTEYWTINVVFQTINSTLAYRNDVQSSRSAVGQ